MGSELYPYTADGNDDQLIVRIPTVTLEDEQRKGVTCGSKLYISFESKVMHFFDAETDANHFT